MQHIKTDEQRRWNNGHSKKETEDKIEIKTNVTEMISFFIRCQVAEKSDSSF